MSDQTLLQTLMVWSALAVMAAWIPWPRVSALLVASCGVGFLAMMSPWSLALLLMATMLTYLLQVRGLVSRGVLIGGTLVAAGMYFGLLVATEHDRQALGLRVVLPLGLAFYVLRLVHYLIECYKGNLRVHGLTDCLAYQFLPCTLPAGPIHRFDEFLRDWRRKRWDSGTAAYGAQRILYGLVKLVVIGNYLIGEEWAHLQVPVDGRTPLGAAYVALLLFWLKLYTLFSGYSDLAIGFGALMGLKIRENFNWPFVARNIADFWQRWHASLSSWCRDYVFTPVLSLTRRPVVAVLSAMVVLGLWHDWSLRYVFWGAYHGAGIAAFRWFDARGGRKIDALPAPLAMAWHVFAILLTLNFVIFSFVFIRVVERFMGGG